MSHYYEAENQMKSKKILVIFMVTVVLVGFGCIKKPDVPDKLIGVWTTAAPIYEGCFFELTRKEIIFGAKDGTVSSYYIKELNAKKIPNEEWISYTISYVSRGIQKYSFPLYYHPAGNGVIRFKNKLESVWIRELEEQTSR